MPISDNDLEAIRKREAAATPGPWYWAPEHPEFSDVFSESDLVLPGDTPLMQFEPSRNGAADAEFVAYARRDVPALLTEVERLRAVVAVASDLVAAVDEHFGPPEGFGPVRREAQHLSELLDELRPPADDEPAYPIFTTYSQRQEVLSRVPEAPGDTRPSPSEVDRG